METNERDKRERWQCANCRRGYADTMYLPCKHKCTLINHPLRTLCTDICGNCAGFHDVNSYAAGNAHAECRCPQCNGTVTHRVTLVVQYSDCDVHYIQSCDLNSDILYRIVHGRWRNINVRFRVTYPLIAKSSALVAYRSKSEDELNDEIRGYCRKWCWERAGMRHAY